MNLKTFPKVDSIRASLAKPRGEQTEPDRLLACRACDHRMILHDGLSGACYACACEGNAGTRPVDAPRRNASLPTAPPVDTECGDR